MVLKPKGNKSFETCGYGLQKENNPEAGGMYMGFLVRL
jgi:hypothetical protein